jgi:hypothetical protein
MILQTKKSYLLKDDYNKFSKIATKERIRTSFGKE